MNFTWCRLWHDMPTDPKWRAIAKKSGQRIGDVMAVYNFVLVNASCNAMKRGTTHNLFSEDIGAALDLEKDDIEAILKAMQGKVLDGEIVTGWEKRQPKREDSSADRVRVWRRNAAKRNVTQCNASDTDTDTDTDKNKNKKEDVVISDTPKRQPTTRLVDHEFLELISRNPAYSDLDIQKELGKCEAWCHVNKISIPPSKKRLVSWLNRAYGKAGIGKQVNGYKTNFERTMDNARSVLEGLHDD